MRRRGVRCDGDRLCRLHPRPRFPVCHTLRPGRQRQQILEREGREHAQGLPQGASKVQPHKFPFHLSPQASHLRNGSSAYRRGLCGSGRHSRTCSWRRHSHSRQLGLAWRRQLCEDLTSQPLRNRLYAPSELRQGHQARRTCVPGTGNRIRGIHRRFHRSSSGLQNLEKWNADRPA